LVAFVLVPLSMGVGLLFILLHLLFGCVGWYGDGGVSAFGCCVISLCVCFWFVGLGCCGLLLVLLVGSLALRLLVLFVDFVVGVVGVVFDCI